MNEKPVYSIVIPVFNEEKLIDTSYHRLKSTLEKTEESFEFVFINDGSYDSSLDKLNKIAKNDANVVILDFSRNFGHQIAITAGMDYAKGSAIVIIDADLQDPPEIILKMIEKWKQGFQVVYGKRASRKGESVFKLLTAKLFYNFLAAMTDVDIPKDVGDFRLIDRKVCNAMKQIQERNRFVRGLISWVGFKQTEVLYHRDKRFAGETKYPFTKMFVFAVNAIISFSYKPLRIATRVGALTSLAGFGYLMYSIYIKYFTHQAIQGWASMIALTLIFNGAILLLMGLIGEYIGRIYDESKNRPLYIMNDVIQFKD